MGNSLHFQSIYSGSPGIIPAPRSLVRKPGEFTLHRNIRIELLSGSGDLEPVANYLQDWIVARQGGQEQSGSPAPIRLGIDGSLSAEAYTLEVHQAGITLIGGDPAGVFYGIQSLIQLAEPWRRDGGQPVAIPCLEIQDSPAFSYRGMHLDVGRHLFPVEFLKQFIDLLARYKMNRFHWHLTEDQGWRIEIKKYSRLQEIASIRKETLIGHLNDRPHQFDGKPYGGYYTQEEIKEVVAHARKRFVQVIPEIEMPGHAQAAIAAYPELGCVPEPLEVATHWGIFENVFCPSEQTFAFLEDVLTEVMTLFPGPYIHIGGDECPKKQWRNNSTCQKIIRKNGLKDEYQLQSFFIRRIERFLNDHGRKLIGWDEILEGGLAPHATVMSWQGEKGAIEAARMGHDVIMTPNEHCYFNMYQADSKDEPLAIGGFLTLEKVYMYHPVPPSLSEDEATHILGAQGNVWTEYMPTHKEVEYMTYPRMQALAEAVWLDNPKRDYAEFCQRVIPHLVWFRYEGINAADHLFRS
jgi:hexosaminidase